MAFKISGGQFYPPLPNAYRVQGAVSVSAAPRAGLAFTRAQPGIVSLTAASYTADEGTLLTFNITRTAGATGAIAVDYAIVISEGGPTSGANGTVVWNSGESGAKPTTVQLGLVAATRNGQITLSNARSLSGGVAPTIGGTNPASLQIVNIVSAPAVDVTTFAAEGSGAQVVTFASTFKPGDVPTGQVPVLTDNANTVLSGFQSQVRALHPDGSVRHAIMHGTVNGGQTYKIRTGSPATGTAKTIADFLAAVPGTLARVIFTGGATGTVDLRDLLSSPTNRAVMTFNATSNLRTLEAGPNVLRLRVAQNVGTHLRVNFEVRWYGGSVYWVDIWVVNGYANLNGQNSASYTAQVEINGANVGSPQVFTTTPHYNHCIWHPSQLGYWSGAAGTMYVRHNTQYIQDTGAVPNYRRTQIPSNAQMNALPQFCVPMTTCERRTNIDGTGAADELALLPRWDAAYIKSGGDVRCFRNMLANDEGYCARPAALLNSNNGEYFTENEFPTASINQEVGFGSGYTSGASPFGLSSVNSHLPRAGYTSYLTTGSEFWLDVMHAATTAANLWNSNDRNLTFAGRTVRRHYESSIRGMAWQYASNGTALYITPDNHFLKPQFQAWIDGVSSLVDLPHYGPGGSRRNVLGCIYAAQFDGNQSYPMFYHMFFSQSLSFITLDLGLTQLLPLAQYAGIFMAGMFGSTGEFPYEAAPVDRLKVGPTDNTATPATAVYYSSFAQVRAQNSIPAGDSGTTALSSALASFIGAEYSGARNEVRRQAINDSYYANMLPALGFLHRLGIDGGFECYLRANLSTIVADFSAIGQFDIGMREVALPGYIKNATPLTWTQISNTVIPVPANYPGDPGSRVFAWGGTAVKWLGSEVRFAAAGGHNNASGNSVERLRLNAEVPAWVIERNPTLPASPPNVPYYSDGRPVSCHVYYSQKFHQGRNEHIRHGAQGNYSSGGSFNTVDAYSPATQDWKGQGFFADSTGCGGIGSMKAMSPCSGIIYFLTSGDNNMEFRKWNAATNSTVLLSSPGGFGQQYKAGAVDPHRGIVLHSKDSSGAGWRSYSIENGASTARAPEATGGLTATQQSLLSQAGGAHDWDIRGKRYLYYPQGQDVFAIDPVTFAASVISIAGSPPPPAANGLYSKGGYIPELDIFFVYPEHTGNCYFFKFAATQRPMP